MHTTTRRDFLAKVMAGFGLFAGVSSWGFRRPVRGSDKGSIRLIFYTDVHARKSPEIAKAMKKAVSAINSQRADFVFAGGDLITDGLASSAATAARRWDAYMTMHRALKPDLYPTIGNHDLVVMHSDNKSPGELVLKEMYLQRMGLKRTYYSLDAAGYHFVVLDSVQATDTESKYEGRIGSEQLEWLKGDLAKVSRNTPVVMITHIPLLTAFFEATQGITFSPPKTHLVGNNRDVLKLIENHNVILVMQGHLHVYETIKYRNALFISGGAVCGGWWRGPFQGTEKGYSLITLAENHIDCEYVTYGG